jgi:hypothetical protein
MNEQVIKFGANKKFLVDTSVGVEIQPPSTDPELLGALLNNTSFPARTIKETRIELCLQCLRECPSRFQRLSEIRLRQFYQSRPRNPRTADRQDSRCSR